MIVFRCSLSRPLYSVKLLPASGQETSVRTNNQSRFLGKFVPCFTHALIGQVTSGLPS